MVKLAYFFEMRDGNVIVYAFYPSAEPLLPVKYRFSTPVSKEAGKDKQFLIKQLVSAKTRDNHGVNALVPVTGYEYHRGQQKIVLI